MIGILSVSCLVKHISIENERKRLSTLSEEDRKNVIKYKQKQSLEKELAKVTVKINKLKRKNKSIKNRPDCYPTPIISSKSRGRYADWAYNEQLISYHEYRGASGAKRERCKKQYQSDNRKYHREEAKYLKTLKKEQDAVYWNSIRAQNNENTIAKNNNKITELEARKDEILSKLNNL